MTAPATVAVIIATPHGLRHLATSGEREAAASAEAILRDLGAAAERSSFWVQCADAGARARLNAYLAQVRVEVLSEAAQGAT